MKVKEAAGQPAVAAKPAQPFKQVLAQAKPQGPVKAAAPKSPLAAVPATAAGPKPKVQLPQVARPQAPLARAATALGLRPMAQAAQARSVALDAHAQVTQQARSRVVSEANRLVTVRAEHAETAQAAAEVRSAQVETSPKQPIDERMLKLICRELERDEKGAPRTAANAEHGPQAPGVGQAQVSDVKAEAKARGEQAVALIEKIEVFVKSQRPALALTLNNSLGARVEIERLGPGEVGLKLVGQNGPPSPDTLSRIREELGARGLKVKALSVS